MSGTHAHTVAYVADSQIPPSPPPPSEVGVWHWLRENLFYGWLNAILTILSILLLVWLLPGFIEWALLDAVWNAGSLQECREKGDGACWAVIRVRWLQLLYGFYPTDQLWRPNLAFILMFVALAPVLFDFGKLRLPALAFTLVYPIVAFWLIWGGFFGLEEVRSARLGGFLLALVIGVTGIAASLPLGILLALGRQSNMFFIKTVCVGFIEFIRGVPLIALLFIASTMLNYFLPPGTEFDLLLRVLIMVTLFSSAYIAEVVRGGLQAVAKGQYEAADSMGLTYWQSMRLIVLPQALKISIPGIVNTFIGLYKDTTLVIIIGLLDVLGVMKSALADPKWNGLAIEVYIYTAVFFFISCFAMSRYSLYLEKKLHTGHKR